MTALNTWSDAVFRYIDDIGFKVVAETGIVSDRYHLGKIILKCFREDPEFLLQIDGATNERDTFGSMLEKSIRCAEAFRNLGIKQGDVIVLMACTCLDLTAPMYACFYLGVNAACIDMTLQKEELLNAFNDTKPKFVFCLGSKAVAVQEALNQLGIEAEIATYGKEASFNTFPEFLEKYSDNGSVQDFQPEDFDTKDTIGLLVSTSGSTGFPKTAALSHSNLINGLPNLWVNFRKYPTPTRLALIISPVQWLSALVHFVMSPILKYTRLQSSLPITQQHVYEMINKYRPTYLISSPTFMTTLLRPGDRDQCDFSSMEHIYLGGSVVSQEVVNELKIVQPNARVFVGYGLSECSGLCFNYVQAVRGSCGTPVGQYQYRIVDIDTQKVIEDANVSGELWIKGPAVFKGYWNRPNDTMQALTEDGWLRTGDIMYRDESWNFYFVDRMKLLLKYRNHQVSPAELENVIRKHPKVLDVAVTGIRDLECGDLPVACVITRDSNVTEDEIKDLVKASLSDTKQLRGGVIFMKELPTTSTGKVDRPRLKAIANSR
ncbi:luciferin 4-monooxygenase-like [Colias croceus]|uniref:luciferin 4-monooxygenase-like n=1 Tax=Colias crocea TaxID=72248 RepID=UPI001E27DCBF|nr:luciferin 4-monooxygenase-like [Colias croceus]XP_045503708.1 luciferin 4-monooxygenase-like [Colias croceus]